MKSNIKYNIKFNRINNYVLIIFLVILLFFLFKTTSLDYLFKESFIYGGILKDSLIKHSLVCSGENQALLPNCKNNSNIFG